MFKIMTFRMHVADKAERNVRIWLAFVRYRRANKCIRSPISMQSPECAITREGNEDERSAVLCISAAAVGMMMTYFPTRSV